MFKIDPKRAIERHSRRHVVDEADSQPLSWAAEEIIRKQPEPTLSGAVISGIAQIVEAFLLAALGYGIHLAYVDPAQDYFYIPVVLVTALLANVAFNVVRSHRIAAYRDLFGQLGRVLAGWAAVMILLTVTIFFFKASDMVSRVWLLSWFLSGAAVAPGPAIRCPCRRTAPSPPQLPRRGAGARAAADGGARSGYRRRCPTTGSPDAGG